MKAYALTHVGKVRTGNEDAYYLPKGGERFCAVADGMGGHRAGEVASALAIEILSRCLREAAQPGEDALRAAVERANRAIYEAAAADADKRGMGTTLTALWFDASRAHLSHVGDSRAYLLRNRALMQLTNDHSLVGQLVAQGELTPSQARSHPRRNVITKALGTDRHVMPDFTTVDRLPGDVWLLCTDGLSNLVRDSELTKLMQGGGTWPEKLQKIVDLALTRGAPDNVTALVALGPEEGRSDG